MADTEEDNPNDCSMHKCIFDDDYRKLSQLIRTHDVAQKDKHGKYTLHINSRSVIDYFITTRFWNKKANRHYSVLFHIFPGNTALHLSVMLGRKGN